MEYKLIKIPGQLLSVVSVLQISEKIIKQPQSFTGYAAVLKSSEALFYSVTAR